MQLFFMKLNIFLLLLRVSIPIPAFFLFSTWSLMTFTLYFPGMCWWKMSFVFILNLIMILNRQWGRRQDGSKWKSFSKNFRWQQWAAHETFSGKFHLKSVNRISIINFNIHLRMWMNEMIMRHQILVN